MARSVIVVCDSIENRRRSLVELLLFYNHAVHEVDNPRDALRASAQYESDLVVMDDHIPASGMTGRQAASLLAKREAAVLIMTDDPTKASSRSWIMRPFEPQTFLNKINGLLSPAFAAK
ncbi:response regulator [Patescibacteria group bacterium]|nr:response regulator [Patescibacteria group bacterium]